MSTVDVNAKIPNNVVERFGNSGGATIPIALTINIADHLKTGRVNACLAGFGAGLTWAAMLMTVGPLSFCELIDYN